MSQEELPQRPQGVIASLAVGFEFAAQHLSLLGWPILLDLFLWLGPRLSPAPLAERMVQMWESLLPAETMGPEYHQLFGMVREAAANSDLFGLLSPAPLLGVPSLRAYHPVLTSPLGERVVVGVRTPWAFFGWVALLLVAGMGLNALYLWRFARHFRAQMEEPLPAPPSPWRIWGRLLGLLALLLGGVFVILFPGLTLIGLLAMLSPFIAALLEMLFLSALLLFLLHLIYVLPSILLLDAPLLRAIAESFTLSRLYFNSTLLLAMTLMVIEAGMNFVWTLPPADRWSTLLGIVGHAFIATALLGTLFTFYHQRLVYLESLKRSYQAKVVRPQVKSS